jgi:hypothetical protein
MAIVIGAFKHLPSLFYWYLNKPNLPGVHITCVGDVDLRPRPCSHVCAIESYELISVKAYIALWHQVRF